MPPTLSLTLDPVIKSLIKKYRESKLDPKSGCRYLSSILVNAMSHCLITQTMRNSLKLGQTQ